MALPLKKRLYRGSEYSLAKRVKRVERMARSNRPEMQTKSYILNTTLAAGAISNSVLTNISQGTGISERRGDEVRVWRVEIRGLSDDTIDHYLFQLHTTSEPTTAVIQSNPGGFLIDSETNSRFTEWKHYRNYSGNGTLDPLRIVQNFKGMKVKYNGPTSTAGISNQVCYTALNNTGTARNVQVSIRIWYTDP